MLKPEFGSEIEAVPEVEVATHKPKPVGEQAELGIYLCCGKNCSCR